MTYLYTYFTNLFLSSLTLVPHSVCGCNANYSMSSGYISTPNYPSNYSDNMHCENIIRMPDGSILHFKWESFRVVGQMPDCKEDYVLITRCDSPSLELIRYCGTSFIPHQMYFITDCVRVEFKSNNDSMVNDGFRIFYNIYNTVNPFNVSTVNSTSDCFEETFQTVSLQNNSAMIKSPNWPLSYGKFVQGNRCKWKINLPANAKIKVFYMYMNLYAKNSISCRKGLNNDFLIFKGIKDNETVNKEQFCGINPLFAKYYDNNFDSVALELIVNNHGKHNNTGFVIGLVAFDGVDKPVKYFNYWWLIVIVILSLLGFIRCLRKKSKQRSGIIEREERLANDTSMTAMSTTSNIYTIPSRPTRVSQHRKISTSQPYHYTVSNQATISSEFQISYPTTIDPYSTI